MAFSFVINKEVTRCGNCPYYVRHKEGHYCSILEAKECYSGYIDDNTVIDAKCPQRPENGPVKYNYDIVHCPGYKGHIPHNLNHEVCKHCGSIKYYH